MNLNSLYTHSLKPFRGSFALEGVAAEVHASRNALRLNDDAATFISFAGFCAVCMTTAALLFVFGGYEAGFHTINSLARYLSEDFLQITTFMGDTAVALCLMLFFARRNPSLLFIILLAAIYGTLVTHGMKAYFDMLRPPAVLNSDDFVQIGQAFKRASFPSGHSATVFIMVSCLYYFATQISTKIMLLTFGAWVAISRVLVGAHWPVDILVGSGVGVMATAIAIYSAKRWSWGFSVRVHFFVLSLLIAAAIILFSHSGGYPNVSLFAKLCATASLTFFVADYFFSPYVPKGSGTTSHRPPSQLAKS